MMGMDKSACIERTTHICNQSTQVALTKKEGNELVIRCELDVVDGHKIEEWEA